MEITPGPLLGTIQSPADLKKLTTDQLQQAANELRQYIIDIVSLHGGHLVANKIVRHGNALATNGGRHH